MIKYFNLFLEFDRNKLEKKLVDISLTGRGYCCFIDQVLLVESNRQKNINLKNIINNASINSCDGSSIAFIVNILYKKNYKAYNGPEFFNKFIFLPGKHCIVGNTMNVFNKVKQKLKESGHKTSNLFHISLPFLKINQFNFDEISNEINKIKPQYIWISLGAPKQEEFMYKILPKIDQGIMLGIGAAINWFTGEIKDIPNWIIKLRLIWIYRIITEPKKQIPRIVKIIIHTPKLIVNERRKIKLNKQNTE